MSSVTIVTSFRHHGLVDRTMFVNFCIVMTLFLQSQTIMAQPVEIRKAIKEELLPGFVVADLSSDTEFLNVINQALNPGSPMRNSPPVPGNGLQYNVITSGNSHSQYFAVDVASGVVTIRRSIDRERLCSFKDECTLSFQIAARSVYGGFFQLISFIITIVDINDNPPEFTQSKFDVDIPENAEVGRTFQLPTAFDRDAGASNRVKEYRILQGPPQFGLRTVPVGVNSSDVYLSLDDDISREVAVRYKVLVGAIDGGIPPLTGTLTVEVLISDVNDNFPIFEHSLYTKSIPEITGNDQVIVQVVATDADSGPNGELVYSFSAQQPQDDLDFFRIDPKTGEIFLTTSVEARAGDEIELLVEASDQGHPPKISRTVVKIHIEDTINSIPDIIIDTLGGSQEGIAEVSEYAEVGKVVGFISVRDADSGDNGRTSCRLSSPEFQLVTLDDDGKYKAELMTSLDRETKDTYNITLSCSDSGFPPLTATADFTVKVMDENDHAPVFSKRNYEAAIFENNTVGAFITQVTASDADAGANAEISFGISGANRNYFHVDETGKVVAKVSLDRELSDQMMITVTATDSGTPPLSSSTVVTVKLLDVNDVRPEFSDLVYMFDIEEELFVGSFVGVLSAMDTDLGSNKEVTYRFLDSRAPWSDSFVISADDGVIRTNSVLDREDRDMFHLIALAVDKGVPPLTGSATVIIKIIDINDNDPFFIFPVLDNNTIFIPHSVQPSEKITTVQAVDVDQGLNAKIIYSISSVNTSSPFEIDPLSGALFVKERFSRGKTGTYMLTIMANDQGPKQQRATQIPFYIEVYFDNSTLASAVDTAELPVTLIAVFAGAGIVLLIILIILVILLCIKRRKAKTKFTGNVPNSASTSSTTKLQGGYYIAPGVHGSGLSFPGKHPIAGGSHVEQEVGDGTRTNKPYIVVLPNSDTEASAEIVEIAINGHQNGFSDNLDLSQIDDDRFSTFRSQENILAPGLRYGSLRRQEQNSSPVVKKDDNFDNLSCDDSTSDSGRGGSDVDINNAAAAAKQARAKASTPISVKSGISPRLSPLPPKENTLVTFRGQSPNTFNFDSESGSMPRGSLPRGSQAPRGSSAPTTADPRKIAPTFGSGSASAFSSPAGETYKNNSDVEQNSRHFMPLQPAGSSGPSSHDAWSHDYRDGGETYTDRLSPRSAPLNNLSSHGTYPRHDIEAALRGRGLQPSHSLTRRNPLPLSQLSSGPEVNHQNAYGATNRNNLLKHESPFQNGNSLQPTAEDLPSNYSRTRPHSTDFEHSDKPGSQNGRRFARLNSAPQSSGNASYGSTKRELRDSHADSVEEDFLLPPYPEVEGEEDDVLTIRPGFTDYDPQMEAERSALFFKSRFESSA